MTPADKRDIETLKATLDAAQRDVEAENDRMGVLDAKLSNLATLAGLTLSISVTLGGTVVVAGKFCQKQRCAGSEVA